MQLQPAPHQEDHTTCLSGALLPLWLEHPLHAGHRAKRVGGSFRRRSLFLCLITKDRSHWNKSLPCSRIKRKRKEPCLLLLFFFNVWPSVPMRVHISKRYCYHFQTLTVQPRGLRCLISPFFPLLGAIGNKHVWFMKPFQVHRTQSHKVWCRLGLDQVLWNCWAALPVTLSTSLVTTMVREGQAWILPYSQQFLRCHLAWIPTYPEETH